MIMAIKSWLVERNKFRSAREDTLNPVEATILIDMCPDLLDNLTIRLATLCWLENRQSPAPQVVMARLGKGHQHHSLKTRVRMLGVQSMAAECLVSRDQSKPEEFTDSP
jgi:hypothetical protein